MLERETEFIVASSPQQEYVIDGLSHLQKGGDYGDITISTVTGFLTNPPWGLNKIKDADQFRRSLDFPYLNIRSIKSAEATSFEQPYQQADGLDWVSILVTQPQLQLSLSRQLSFLISLAVLIVFLWLLMREIGRAVQQECRDRSRMPSSA
eukprot:TRINITY_DN3217_c0_g1_i1.p1 TRINITY_DN3217_c0_g1~~TRINITY_DN3217_c0_g1_i1.p1  ORF type:complete len:151 (-),score=24.22 TRINITY_DN3217_c0_g1_i1:11-463(-)